MLRCFTPPTWTRLPPEYTSIGPRTRNSTTQLCAPADSLPKNLLPRDAPSGRDRSRRHSQAPTPCPRNARVDCPLDSDTCCGKRRLRHRDASNEKRRPLNP